MSGWPELAAALDAVAGRGEVIRFWWRDDDAGRHHSALARLLELADGHALALALAVVPAWLEPEAQGLIAASSGACVLQHGYAHANHAEAGARRFELGGRPPEAIERELAQGRVLLVDAFGADALAVLVPPWNRIAPALLPALPRLGFAGLSAFGRRTAEQAAPGLAQVNAHLDPIDWHGSRLFIGEQAAVAQLVDALSGNEPVGILSHHLAMDEPGWRFLDRLLEALQTHPAACWCSARELFEAAA